MAQIAKIAIENAVYAIDKPYDYLIPEGMTVCAGMRVTVPFGRGNRRSEGMVLSVQEGTMDRPLKAVETPKREVFFQIVRRLTYNIPLLNFDHAIRH